MVIKDHPSKPDFVCPLCGTNKDAPVVLVGIDGTQKDGFMDVREYHVECIHLIEIKLMENDEHVILHNERFVLP